MGQKDENFFKIDDHEGGIPRELAAGVTARIFPGAQAMVSVVRLNPNSHTKSHAHPQEQLGVPSVGKRHADSGRRGPDTPCDIDPSGSRGSSVISSIDYEYSSRLFPSWPRWRCGA